ncbi:phage tail domain-containing protein [Clostridium grantii]|uniref:Putative phage tail component, N-terminal domain-containing protein n=1 Tax=Clostridium grantii DSM 8605 TaxID=1121316 RepID=A0A1M5SC50_9CLOT|nr:phage tail domain-containing protein [Clostridium grantii]SHH36020.1 putative phage tail component, N-terminal domain-containing protein [Clostridium grantii DSM 8605]
MALPYFIFNGIDSRDIDGIVVIKLPDMMKAQKDINKIEIEGRDGFLTEDLGSYRGTVKTVECTLKANADIDYISSWLDGSGEVTFSNEEYKVYDATIINSISFKEIFNIWHSIIIQFECQPFKRDLSTSIITLTSSNSTVYNNGTTTCKPIIKVFGEGNINITINNNTFNLTNVDEYVIVDSDLLECYKDTELKNADMNGDFPLLHVGENTISYAGTVTKIEIQLNLRYK